MRKFFREFKAFISKGNVFDMAVGLIIATAFNKIVSSMVNDILMPLVTYATGAASLAELSLPLRIIKGEVTLSWNYGNFLQTVIDFLIIAFSVFCMVKIVTNSQKKFKELGDTVMKTNSKEYRAERKSVKALAKEQNRPFKQVWKEHEEEKQRLADEKTKAEAEAKAEKEKADRLANPTTEDLLKDIRDLLKDKEQK